jgi:glutathione peroxidase
VPGFPARQLLQHTFDRLQDEKPQSLCQYSGKVLLVVNTASYCGFTGQYKGLEALYARYKSKGLVVLGFPIQRFFAGKRQQQQIADFCENTFGVKFPMFAKSSVKGPQASPLYRQLARSCRAGAALELPQIPDRPRRPRWWTTTPASRQSRQPQLVRAIEQQLARPVPRASHETSRFSDIQLHAGGWNFRNRTPLYCGTRVSTPSFSVLRSLSAPRCAD